MAAIGEVEAKQIFSAQEAEGKLQLAQLMNLGPYDEEINLKQVAKVDFFYDHLTFAAKKGFPWENVCDVVQFAEEFLATATDGTITEAIRLYQAQSPNLLLELGERSYKLYTDFLFSTFFTHFQLFKFLVAKPREEVAPQVNIDVHPPMPPVPLNTGKEELVWKYEKEMENLNTREFELMKKRLVQNQANRVESAARKQELEAKVDATQPPYTKTALGEMLRSVMSDYVKATGVVLTTAITEVREDLEVKIEKTVLPRPAVLGPPTRYRPKSPILLNVKPTPSTSKGDKKGANNNNKNANSNSDKPPKSPKSSKSSARSRTSSSRASKR